VSAFFGTIDAVSGHMAYSLAGHPPAIVARAGEAPALLAQDGTVLGAAGRAEYGDHETTLDIGDLLVLYTDGLLEARSPSGESFGTDRLLRAVHEHADESAEQIPESLFLTAFSFADGHLADDMAIVALRRTSAPGGIEQPRLDLDAAVA
jgi:sigma-B regulation protein RsbU (phosphoserine phosphatase)